MLPEGPDYRAILRSLGISAKVAARVADAWPQPATLATASPAQLRRFGVTPVQASRLLGAVELARLASRPSGGAEVMNPQGAAALLAPLMGLSEQEIMVVVLLTPRQRVIDVRAVGLGSISRVDVHPRELFRDAIRASASSILVAHNHPSGDPNPSPNDHTLTARIADAGRMLGIPLVDHLILARGGGWFSFAEAGLIDHE